MNCRACGRDLGRYHVHTFEFIERRMVSNPDGSGATYINDGAVCCSAECLVMVLCGQPVPPYQPDADPF